MLSVSIWRLKGSVGELSRCRRMIERSMMVPEGSLTGSVIRVSIRGSVETEGNTLTQQWRLILKNKSRRFLPGDRLRESHGGAVPQVPTAKGKQHTRKRMKALPSMAAVGRRKDRRWTARQQVSRAEPFALEPDSFLTMAELPF